MSTTYKIAAMGCLLFSLNACAESQPSTGAELTRVSMDGQTLELVNLKGKCSVLKHDNTYLAMDLAWPCQFSRNRKGLPRVEMFNSVPIVVVLHNEPASLPNISCLQTTQAVRLRDGALETSSVSQHAMCSTGHDQKMFVGMFRW